MRILAASGTSLLLALVLAACGEVSGGSVDAAPIDDPCDACDTHATCEGTGDQASCVCDDGYEGDGETCADVDECATDNGGCDVNATCTNTDGGRTCACNHGSDGDGMTCTVWVDEARRGCAALQAEHPGYTTIARDVALCGSKYTPADMATACHTGWHVCTASEWQARYPQRPYKVEPTDPDLIGPTIGPLTSWGADQAARCGGGVWEDRHPLEPTMTWEGSVCFYADDVGTNGDGADYLPFNSGKYLFADDGTTVLQGHNAQGEPDCCSWDVTFQATEQVDSFAVYCCLD